MCVSEWLYPWVRLVQNLSSLSLIVLAFCLQISTLYHLLLAWAFHVLHNLHITNMTRYSDAFPNVVWRVLHYRHFTMILEIWHTICMRDKNGVES
jgi:hypothetical protein